MSEANNYATIVATRILIGAAQSFTQNSGIYNSFWYTRREIATRGGESNPSQHREPSLIGHAALIFSTATLSGAFSGLIAYAIGEDLAHSSRSPWSWLFLIEGVIAVFVGVLVIIFLPAFPDRMKNGKNWLFTRDEINLALERTSSTWWPRRLIEMIC
jgi:MFS family permease